MDEPNESGEAGTVVDHLKPERIVNQSSFQYLAFFIAGALIFYLLAIGMGEDGLTPLRALVAVCWIGASGAGALAGRYAKVRIGGYVIGWRQWAAGMWAGIGAVIALTNYMILSQGTPSLLNLFAGLTIGLGAAACAVIFPIMTLRGQLGFQSDVDAVLDILPRPE